MTYEQIITLLACSFLSYAAGLLVSRMTVRLNRDHWRRDGAKEAILVIEEMVKVAEAKGHSFQIDSRGVRAALRELEMSYKDEETE